MNSGAKNADRSQPFKSPGGDVQSLSPVRTRNHVSHARNHCTKQSRLLLPGVDFVRRACVHSHSAVTRVLTECTLRYHGALRGSILRSTLSCNTKWWTRAARACRPAATKSTLAKVPCRFSIKSFSALSPGANEGIVNKPMTVSPRTQALVIRGSQCPRS